MNILVTGATGFIGRHVVERLMSLGHSVTAVARNACQATEASRHGQVKFISADIHDPATFEILQPASFDAVMHLAWPGLPNYSVLTHLEQTLPAECAFLKGLVQAGVTQLLITGTCFEYGLQLGCLNELTIPAPVTPYAIAKNTLRVYLEALKKEQPFRLQWARLFYMYGEGQNQKSLLAQLDTAIERGDAIFDMSGGEQLRDYLPVEKIAEHLVELAERPTFDGIVNVCSGEPISVRRLVEDHIARRGAAIKPNLGCYPYPEYEPMAFWGDSTLLRQLLISFRNNP
jgi:dTDP-6-deoxy-L-talose 4-dehydrogenase (NAD+)